MDKMIQFIEKYGERIAIGNSTSIADDVTINISKGAKLEIGNNTSIGRGTHIELLKNSTFKIGDNVSIGNNCYLCSMSKVIIGDDVAISNMVDLHDHNHKDRSIVNLDQNDGDGNASGFEVAPIFIEHGATISSKVSITAGVRIGQNTKIGANAVVSRSLPPNIVAIGSPAKKSREFIGTIKPFEYPCSLNIGFFGTSIMQHLEAYVPSIYNQMNLPEIGAKVDVIDWRKRGYVKLLENYLTVEYPYVDFVFDNYGIGGANTNRIIKEIDKRTEGLNSCYDICFLSAGINDVWRKFQGREDEAVDRNTYKSNYHQMILKLKSKSRRLICLSETPFNKEINSPENMELYCYNEIAKECAKSNDIPFINLWHPFLDFFLNKNTSNKDITLWADEAHLTEVGDTLILNKLFSFLKKEKMIEDMLTIERKPREDII